MEVEHIEIDYAPREQFKPFHDRTQRFSCIVAHRRAGKTVACVNDLQRGALTCDLIRPRYAYLSPYLKQSKSVAWDYLRAAMSPLRALGAEVNESELRVDYHNGGQVRLYGADNAEALRGIYLDGVVLDEYGDMDPRVYPEIIRPALSDRGGWAVFIGTPKGKNQFHQTYRQSLGFDPRTGVFDQSLKDRWFSLMLRASETGLVSTDELQLAHRDMSDNQYAQEYECSFEAPVKGAFWGDLLVAAHNRIGRIAADPLLPLRAFIDIGGAGRNADAFVIWICQWVAQEIRVLDFYEAVGQPLAAHVSWLRSKGYEKAICHLPHDGVVTNNITGKKYEDHLRDAGFDVPMPTPNQGKGAAKMRIEAVRRIFPKLWFNESTTESGRAALAHYHEKWDEERNVGLGPEHDWASHAADAFGLMAVCYEEPSRARAFSRKIEYPKSGVA